MKTLSATLLAAQRSAAARPWVRVTVDDRHVGVGRPRPVAVYEGGEGDGPCAMVACGGYVLRAWTDASGDLRLCRVAAGATMGWGDWVTLASGVSTAAQVVLAVAGSNVYLLYVSGDGANLLCRRSEDGGVSWAAAEVAHQAEVGCRILSLAAVCGTVHECVCVFADDAQGEGPDDMVHVAWRQQGQWTTMPWPRDAGDGVAGLAAVAQGGNGTYTSVHFALCGAFEDTTRPAVRLYHLQLTADGQRLWLHRGSLLLADAPGVTWAWPALAAEAGAADRPRLFVTQTGPEGIRLGRLFMPRLDLIGALSAGDFLPMAEAAPQGVGVAVIGGDLYCGRSAWVWRAPLYSGAPGQRLDASADVVAYQARSTRRGNGSSEGLSLLLDDSRRRYAMGTEGPLRVGSQVCLREGYQTALGGEVALQAPYWIEEVEWAVQAPPLYGYQVTLRCYNGWGKLWRSLADRAYEWHEAPAGVLTEALERFGFCYSDDGSRSLYVEGTSPRFSLAVGQSWGSLVAKVLDYCGCELRFSVNAEEEETWPSARAHVFTPGDDVCYAYGRGEHPAITVALAEREAPAWVQLYGDDVFAEALDEAALAAMGFPAVSKVVDLRLNAMTDVTAAQAAAFALRRHGWERQGGWLAIRPNVGQELMDVVSAPIGQAVGQRRVLGIDRRYDRRRGIYEHKLLLGGV